MNNQKFLYGEKFEQLSLNVNMNEMNGDIQIILQSLNEINDNQQFLIEKITGNRIGKIQEYFSLLELKSSFPNDYFSDEKSDKHGTDIIATVRESNEDISQITISIKHHKKWNSEFISQLEHNISQDGTSWGFLITTVFPSEALNKKIWTVCDSNGRLILLVKPEFASIAYYAIRMIIIYELKLLEKINEISVPFKKKNYNVIQLDNVKCLNKKNRERK